MLIKMTWLGRVLLQWIMGKTYDKWWLTVCLQPLAYFPPASCDSDCVTALTKGWVCAKGRESTTCFSVLVPAQHKALVSFSIANVAVAVFSMHSLCTYATPSQSL